MALWLTLAVNSIAFGGLPFLLSAGFSLMLGLVPISNLMHGSFFMLGAYFGVTLLAAVGQFLGRGAGERTRYGDHWGRGAALLRRLVGDALSATHCCMGGGLMQALSATRSVSTSAGDPIRCVLLWQLPSSVPPARPAVCRG